MIDFIHAPPIVGLVFMPLILLMENGEMTQKRPHSASSPTASQFVTPA